jgi:hypothetical protein
LARHFNSSCVQKHCGEGINIEIPITEVIIQMAAPSPIGKTKRSESASVPVEEHLGQNASEVSLPLEERIRLRAYEIYQTGLKNGGKDGSELNDWLQAEAEIGASQETES